MSLPDNGSVYCGDDRMGVTIYLEWNLRHLGRDMTVSNEDPPIYWHLDM